MRLFREEERSVWQYIPQNSGGWVSYFGELRGLKGIKAPKRLEVMPYGVSDVRRFPGEAGNPFATGRESNFSGGADIKMGVTGDLTLDVTINPDFGPVEADPIVVEASRLFGGVLEERDEHEGEDNGEGANQESILWVNRVRPGPV